MIIARKLCLQLWVQPRQRSLYVIRSQVVFPVSYTHLYLLCRTENREQINTPLTELHLNDEMVALLRGGRINNRLLCELATHKDFIKLLAYIEIYLDGIATMQIQNLNALVDTVRHEIIERYRPGEDDQMCIRDRTSSGECGA